MKSLLLNLSFLMMNLLYADFGKIVDCPTSLKNIKTTDSKAECRQGNGAEISLYSAKDEKIYIEEGKEQLKILNFEVKKAQHCLDLGLGYFPQDVAFNIELGKWVIYKTDVIYGNVEMIYLLDKDYDLKKFVQTFVIENYPMSLDKMLTFQGSKAKIVDKDGKIYTVDVTTPSLEEMKREAYNFFEMRYTGWTFMENGLGNYPAYDKIVAIFTKCEALTKEKKKKKCFQKEGELLQLDILQYVKANFKDSYEKDELIKFLGGDKNYRKQLYVVERLYHGYKEMRESQVMNLNYRWEDDSIGISRTISHFGSAPSHQFTYYLNSGNTYLSIGEFA